MTKPAELAELTPKEVDAVSGGEGGNVVSSATVHGKNGVDTTILFLDNGGAIAIVRMPMLV